MPTTQQILEAKARADAAARRSRRYRIDREATRPDGVRVKLSAIPGLTRGDARRVLKAPYHFQCAPMEDLGRPRTFGWNRASNYKGEEYLSRGGSQLKTITFQTLAVEWGGFVIEQYWDVEWLVEALERLTDAGWPFRLLATQQYGRPSMVDMVAALESYTPSMRAGENDAEYMDLTFVEYDDPIMTRKSRSASRHFPVTITLFRDGKYRTDAPKNHSARKLDALDESEHPLTLRRIAQHAYGKSSLGRFVGAAQKPQINDWGVDAELRFYPRFKKPGAHKIVVPEPPQKT